jgi:hypothetical protein
MKGHYYYFDISKAAFYEARYVGGRYIGVVYIGGRYVGVAHKGGAIGIAFDPDIPGGVDKAVLHTGNIPYPAIGYEYGASTDRGPLQNDYTKGRDIGAFYRGADSKRPFNNAPLPSTYSHHGPTNTGGRIYRPDI